MNEKGRSMVEMLGVLAIIGILSAGGLAGYSKAMFQHRTNETINTVSLVLQRLVDLSQKDLGDDFSIATADDMVKYGLLDKCQETREFMGTIACKLPTGGLEVRSLPRYIAIWFSSAKECVAFASVHWENVLPVEWWNGNGYLDIGGASDTLIYDPSENVDRTSLSDITEICEQECDGGVCYMEIGLGNAFQH